MRQLRTHRHRKRERGCQTFLQPVRVQIAALSAVISAASVSDLIMSIKQLNPEKILFITENNRHVLSALKKDHRFALYQNRVVPNLLKSREWFCFPAPPANPNLFKSEVDDARSHGNL